MPFINKLILNNFKSVASGVLDLDDLTVLVGRNGSGKSNVAAALGFLASAMDKPLDAVFSLHGGAVNVARKTPRLRGKPLADQSVRLGIGVIFGERKEGYYASSPVQSGRYAIEVEVHALGRFEVIREQCVVRGSDGRIDWFDRSQSSVRSNVEFLNTAQSLPVTKNTLMFPLAGGIINFVDLYWALRSMKVYSIEPSTLREFQNPDAGEVLLPDGSNATSIVKKLRESHRSEYDRVCEILSSIVPNITSVSSVPFGRKEALRFVQSWGAENSLWFDAFNMSDGTLRCLGLLLAVFQPNSPMLLVIEEPETSVHPGAADAIVDVLKAASTQHQVLITTHSPEVLDAEGIGEANLRAVNWIDGATQIGSIPINARNALQQHLCRAGQLFRMQVLDAPDLFDEVSAAQITLFEEVG